MKRRDDWRTREASEVGWLVSSVDRLVGSEMAQQCGITTRSLRTYAAGLHRPRRNSAAGSQHGRCAYMRLDYANHDETVRLGDSTVAAHLYGWTTPTTARQCGWVTTRPLRIYAAGLH